MTEIIPDTVQVDMRIDGDKWLLSEGKVELSQKRTPNFADINKMAPDTEAGTSFSNPNDLIGKSFSLNVDNQLISERDTGASEKTLLFKGEIANISSLGTGVYEARAYDPSKAPLIGEKTKQNLLNQKVEIQNPAVSYTNNILQGGDPYTTPAGSTEYTGQVVVTKASKVLDNLVSETVAIPEVDNQLSTSGKKVTGPRGTYEGAKDTFLRFDTSEPTLETVLQKIAEETKSRWWFDRERVLHFGIPEPTIHSPQLIIDTSAGLTTPPYQSVKVIGSGLASAKGQSESIKNPDEPIVKGANLTLTGSGEVQAEIKDLTFGEPDDLVEPTFEYKNLEIVTDELAKNTVEKIAEDLGKQYVNGKVTVVGFPEVKVFDVIIMPHAEKSKRNVGNYSPRQPMGGGVFGVYKVVHKLNPSDGFVTDIHTAGLNGPASVVVEQESFVNGSASPDGSGSSSEGNDSGVGLGPGDSTTNRPP